MAEEGKYLTSFLEIYVNTDKDLNNLATLDPEEQGTYYHEYFHYIQDVTTSSGLAKIWNGFDRFRQLVVSIQPPTITEVNVPLDGPVVSEQKAHMNFLEDLRGSGQMTDVAPGISDIYEIAGVIYEVDHKISEHFPRSTATKVRLHLISKGNRDKFFTFGEAAISETMAYLVEKRFYPTLNSLPKYPYRVAHHLVAYIYPDLLNKEENLFALCDVSLMYNMPGWAFVEIQKEMKHQNFIPQSGEDVIKFGYHFYDTLNWDFLGYMQAADEALQHISSQLFLNPHFEATKLLFQASIERGRLLRESHPFAVLYIYRATMPLSVEFYRVFNFLGGPHAVNRQGRRVMRVPSGLEELSEHAHPQYFRVIWQLSRFLMEGLRPCSLRAMCEASENKVPVDDRCEHFPWRRAEDQYGCPYAAFWVSYGFHLKDFYLNGTMIQQRFQE